VRTALVAFGPVNAGSVLSSALEGLRLLVMLSVFGAFNSVTDPYRMVRLAPRRFHEVALASALALSIAPRTVEAAAKVREAQRMRGMNLSRVRALPALAVPVLATGMEEAVTLAESMDARGHGRGPRTRYRPEPWTVGSIVTFVAGVGVAIVFYGFAWLGGGALVVASVPPSWPDASPVVAAAALMLATPGFACSWGTRP
jgi:energy-coupling factor transport system permease protein